MQYKVRLVHMTPRHARISEMRKVSAVVVMRWEKVSRARCRKYFTAAQKLVYWFAGKFAACNFMSRVPEMYL